MYLGQELDWDVDALDDVVYEMIRDGEAAGSFNLPTFPIFPIPSCSDFKGMKRKPMLMRARLCGRVSGGLDLGLGLAGNDKPIIGIKHVLILDSAFRCSPALKLSYFSNGFCG
jgi:hypothetical protein